mgnify:CR=1 FL=1
MEYATIARTALHYVGARFTDKITQTADHCVNSSYLKPYKGLMPS